VIDLAVFVLATWGMTQILVYGGVFDRIRPDAPFFHCLMCVGFHSGWFMFLLFRHAGIQLMEPIIAGMFVFGCIGSAVSFALGFTFTEDGIAITTSPRIDASVIIKEVEDIEDAELKDEWERIQAEG